MALDYWMHDTYIAHFQGKSAIEAIICLLPSFSGYELIREDDTNYKSKVIQVRIIGVTPKEFFYKL